MSVVTPSVAKSPAVQTSAVKLTEHSGLPKAQGLYDPRNEHDACGVGFVANMKGVKSHQIVKDGLFMLEKIGRAHV